VHAHLGARCLAGIGIKHGNPRRLLAAVLQGVEAEIGEVGHRLIRCQHSEHAAGLFRLIGALGVEGLG
jgi:hypothetical protein